MKYLTALLLAATALPLHAADAPQPDSNDQNPPRVYFGTMKSVNGIPTLMPQQTFSRGKNNQFCWLAENLPNGTWEIREHHRASQPSQLFHPKMKISSSADKTEHTAVHPHTEFTPQTRYNQCWTLDPSDPLGQYTLTIKIGDFFFDPWQFEIVE